MSDLARLLQQYGYGRPNALAQDGESFDTSNVLAGMPRPNALANALQVAGVPKDEHGFLFSNVGGQLKFNPWEAVKGFMSYQAPPGALSTSGDDAPVRNTAEAAGWLGLSGLGLNFAGQVPKNALGIFGGRLAKTADHAALKAAEDLDAAGVGRRTIWDATGWFKGADGKWRFEIDDSKARMGNLYSDDVHQDVMKAHIPQHVGYTHTPQAMDLEKYISHPDLERAYWPTREAAPSVVFDNLGHATRGSYSPKNDIVTMDTGSFLRPDEGLSTVLHELQHALQEREGFALGASPKSFTKEQIAAERKRLAAADDGTSWESLSTYTPDMSDETIAQMLYRRAAGEVEARNVQKRQEMSAAERRRSPPWETQDVPDADQIIRKR